MYSIRKIILFLRVRSHVGNYFIRNMNTVGIA